MQTRMNGNTYTVAIPFPFTSCGTIQTTSTTVAGELHKFNNKLWLNKQSNLPYDMPYPVAEFTCSYGYEYDFVTSLRPTVEPLRNEITTTEMFNATVSLCKTGACDQRCPSTYAVAEQAIYTVGEVVHVRFDIDYLRSSTGNKLVVSIDHLFLSCTKDGFSNEPHVDLLYAGCEMSEAFLKPNAGSILKPGSACFSFMVPRLKECEVIYIHATLRACDVNGVNNCPSGKQRCRSSLKRSIRNEIARTVTGPIIIVDGDGGVSSLELFPGGGNGSVPIEVAPMMKVPKVHVPAKTPILEDTTDENFDTPLVLTISIIAAVTCMALFALCCLVPVSKHRHADDQCKCDTLDL
uniref:ZP domain-containing protein n=1 Tax=Ciona savignyi TaxID=51511 RepID=H2Z920_CIOSA